MSFPGFVVGVIMMIIGFFAVRKTDWFLQNLGDLSEMFGAMNARWLSWKLFGVVFLLLGFMIAFGLFEAFFAATIGPLFQFGSPNV